MILSAQAIRERRIFKPFSERATAFGMTYGLGPASYDVRLGRDIDVEAGYTTIGILLEHVRMPNDMLGIVHDKSTLARVGLQLQNTVIDPGFEGMVAIEISYAPLFSSGIKNTKSLTLEAGTPIAQICLHLLTSPTEMPYRGRYQGQTADNVLPRFE